MVRISRRDRSPARFTSLRVGLFFLAAGIWFAGVSIGARPITWVAIGVALAAILLGLVARRASEMREEELEEGREGGAEG